MWKEEVSARLSVGKVFSAEKNSRFRSLMMGAAWVLKELKEDPNDPTNGGS